MVGSTAAQSMDAMATVDVLPAVNCGESSCRPVVLIAAHAAIAVSRPVVEVRAERLPATNPATPHPQQFRTWGIT